MNLEWMWLVRDDVGHMSFCYLMNWTAMQITAERKMRKSDTPRMALLMVKWITYAIVGISCCRMKRVLNRWKSRCETSWKKIHKLFKCSCLLLLSEWSKGCEKPLNRIASTLNLKEIFWREARGKSSWSTYSHSFQHMTTCVIQLTLFIFYGKNHQVETNLQLLTVKSTSTYGQIYFFFMRSASFTWFTLFSAQHPCQIHNKVPLWPVGVQGVHLE